MLRKIIEINEKKCNGCGLCASACHEQAIVMVEGKAKLLRDDYCDGLGDCLPACPTNAISFIEREALAYDEDAVLESQKSSGNITMKEYIPTSKLNQWPVQIKLVPVTAPYFNNCNLLVGADCSAFAYGNFHNEFIKDRALAIGCPKLDDIDYSKKLKDIIVNNSINSITVVRMEVPCCGGIEFAVVNAVKESGKNIDVNVVVITTKGEKLSSRKG